jgi:ParB family chromosome partitioning protein
MKRAPVIPKTVNTTAPEPSSNSTIPAAPVVDSLIARVSAMKSNTITLPVCGRDVKFTLETIPGESVALKTKVWANNERDQDLLTEETLDDLIPSFLVSGQQNPGFGRKASDVIEIADGSRRRMTAILTSCDYRVLVGVLDDEQMDALCKLGNDYRPTSAYERGCRYIRRLNTEFDGNITSLADAENISRKIVTRCINTAKLPREIVALFSHPGELSARAGDVLARVFISREKHVLEQANLLAARKIGGEILSTEEILKTLNLQERNTRAVTRRQFSPGVVAHYKENQVLFKLDKNKLPADIIDKIEEILSKHASSVQ